MAKAGITVCISVFNGADTIETTLESAINQTHAADEILVLDDGSTDGTADLIRRYPVRLVQQSNAGRGAALARMVELANTEWIALLDADDTWESHHLATLQRVRDSQPEAGLIHSQGWFHYADGKIEDRTLTFSSTDGIQHILPDNRILASASAFRRDAMIEVGNFHPATWSACDWYGWLLLSDRWPFHAVGIQTTHYFIRRNSIANKGYRFQEGKRMMLRDLVLPNLTTIFASRSESERAKIVEMIRTNIGVASSTMAKALDHDGKRMQARELHLEAIRLSPRVARVWTRALRHYLGR
jgi:glycosyltransferase involved in cell wall biosynthesis